VPLNVAELTERARAPDDETQYRVWHAVEGNPQGVPSGKYLVDGRGRLRYLVDPGINGVIDRRDDGTEVLKFKAPKARIMALITDGILNQKLPWTLVLLGVFIAVVLELCGVPSLPFAVGVYLPLSSSTPIFAGGLIRYLSDRWARGSGGRPRSASEAEMSPGVLLATGFIAGGAIAGVLVAFLSFSDELPKRLGTWQFRHATISQAEPLAQECQEAAARELGDGQQQKALAGEIAKLNKEQLPRYVEVAAGTTIELPKEQKYEVRERATLGAVAARTLGRADKATLLYELNKPHLKLPAGLPAGATLKIPQGNAGALAAFAVLCVLLLLVGVGWLLASPPLGKETMIVNKAEDS
jgi:hypothetical protein